MQPYLKELRAKITHGSAKVAIPIAIHYAHQMFRCQEGCDTLIHSILDMEDNTRAFIYKVHYFKMLKKILQEKHKFPDDHTIIKALEVSFTLMDSDSAYEDLLKDFYEAEEDYFWALFISSKSERHHF